MKELLEAAWLVLNLRCEEAERLRASPDRSRAHERAAERIHRFLCRSCRRARRDIESIREAAHSLEQRVGEAALDLPRLRPEARARIRARIENSPGTVQGIEPANDS